MTGSQCSPNPSAHTRFPKDFPFNFPSSETINGAFGVG